MSSVDVAAVTELVADECADATWTPIVWKCSGFAINDGLSLVDHIEVLGMLLIGCTIDSGRHVSST